MSGRHRKPHQVPLKIKAVGGVVAGAALAGTVAATAAAAAPNAGPSDGATRQVANVSEVQQTSANGTTTRQQAEPQRAKDRAQTAQSKTMAKAPEPKKQAPRKVTAEQVIKLAKSQLGVSEDGSGETKFNKWFMSDGRALQTLKRDGGDLLGYQDAAWCSMFVSWIGSKLGISGQMGFDAWTPKHAEWFKEHGRWGTTPKPGAVTFFSWSGSKDIYDIDHVGLTIKDNGDGTIETIEGNTDNRVAIRERDESDVVGYGYPDYAK